MNNKKLTFSSIYQWIDKFSSRVTYRSQVDLFEMLFYHYITVEDVHYSASRICQFFKGNAALPAEIITRYQLDDAYISSLMEAVETLLVLDFPDAAAALAELRDMIQADDTLSDIQKNNLLHRANLEGGDASVEWVTDIIRFSMLPRRDTRPIIA